MDVHCPVCQLTERDCRCPFDDIRAHLASVGEARLAHGGLVLGVDVGGRDMSSVVIVDGERLAAAYEGQLVDEDLIRGLLLAGELRREAVPVEPTIGPDNRKARRAFQKRKTVRLR